MAQTTMPSITATRLPYHPSLHDRYNIAPEAWRALVDSVFPSAKSLEGIMLALSYCKARNLDVFKRPVNLVPIWNSALNREIETVWPGIGELRTTAFRTGQYAGAESAVFGDPVTKTFEGEVGRGDRQRKVSTTLTFPEWCQLTVLRIARSGAVHRFPGPKVYWLETYQSQGKSGVPNEMWARRPYGQLEKCAEAAALRRAFPEEIGEDYIGDEAQVDIEGPAPRAEIEPQVMRPQPTVAPLTVELFDAEGTGYRLRPSEIEGWAARQAEDATPEELDLLIENNRDAPSQIQAQLERAIQGAIDVRGGGVPEPRQQPTAPEPPRPSTKRQAPAGEPPAGSGAVTWRGKSYPERPGYAVRMALETLNQCGDWGAVVRVKAEVESLIGQLRAVGHPGAEQVAKALAAAEDEFERPANADDDGPEYSDEGEPELEAAEEDPAESWLTDALKKIDGAPTLGHVRVYGRQLRDEAEEREFDAGVVAQLNAALEAKEKALSGA
jgi:phage recombination protein Bet